MFEFVCGGSCQRRQEKKNINKSELILRWFEAVPRGPGERQGKEAIEGLGALE